MSHKVRLFIDHPFGPGQMLPLSRDQANYLFNVMRLSGGTVLSVFNGRDGEWDARVPGDGRRAGALELLSQTAPQVAPPDLWLLFAPLKKVRTDFVVEKAVELGVRRILPVLTERTNAERVRADRLRAHAVEAAEQSGGTFVPAVDEAERMTAVLAGWPAGRALWFCDESLAADPAAPAPVPEPGPGAVLVGPEGGFSPAERARLAALPFARPVRLGPRILRAETAAIAALVLWQVRQGDWR